MLDHLLTKLKSSCHAKQSLSKLQSIVKLQVLGLRLGVDFTFTLDNNHNNNNNNNDNNDNDNNNPHLNFFKGTVLGVKEQGLGIRDKVSRVKG